MKTLILLITFFYISNVFAKKSGEKAEWTKKNIRDYSDADLERLYEQWEEDDEPLPVDELPEWDPRKPQPQIDLKNMNQFRSPEELLKVSKKGKSLMIFVRVSGNPSRAETEEITALWQTGLRNDHILADRFLLEDDRAIFMFKDGSIAWEAKDYLIEQDRCEDVTIEQKVYHGKHSEKGRAEREDKTNSKTKKLKEKKRENQKKQQKEDKKVKEKEKPKKETKKVDKKKKFNEKDEKKERKKSDEKLKKQKSEKKMKSEL